MRGCVHLLSTNHAQVFENRDQVFCLRSKRSEVRILSGVPPFSFSQYPAIPNQSQVV
jgi:hypothetical protein